MRGCVRAAAVAFSGALILIAMAGPQLAGIRSAAPVAGVAAQNFRPGSLRLYQLDTQGSGLRQLNSRSLRVTPQAPPLRIGPHHSVAINNAPLVAVAPDGAVMAALYARQGRRSTGRAADMTLQLFDARSGKPLTARYHPAIPFFLSGISNDGTRLVGTRIDANVSQPCTATTYYLLNARTGAVLARTRIGAPGMQGWGFATDATLHYLYALYLPDRLAGCPVVSGRAPVVQTFDLETGKRVASIRLNQIQAGFWPTGQMVRGQPELDYQYPGFALSPDGSQLAVLDGRSNTLTLLDAPNLGFEASEPVVRPTSAWEQLAVLLGVAPDVTQAKGEEQGISLSLQYSANGRSLVVTGSRTRIVRNRRFPVETSLGLRLIDVATGRIVAHLPSRKQIFAVWPAPDGSALYTLLPGTSTPRLCPCTIQRRDPRTLVVRAAHTFNSDAGINLYFLRSGR